MKIEKQIDELTKEQWSFYLIGSTLYLNGYILLQRETTRNKKYLVLKNYDRLSKRDSTIDESEVPFSDELKSEVLQEYFKTIDCKKWSER